MLVRRLDRGGVMKIGVVGAGAIGACFGAMLAEEGCEVSLIARGAHLDAIRANGLTIRRGDKTRIRRLVASDKAVEIGPAEVVLFPCRALRLWIRSHGCTPADPAPSSIVSSRPDRLKGRTPPMWPSLSRAGQGRALALSTSRAREDGTGALSRTQMSLTFSWL
jgi:2-dehydropantoate 2-reductase